jgi:predicted dehydrogenase
MSSGFRLTRRNLLRGAAAAAVVGPSVIAPPALGADGRPSPSNRIVMGAIGLGGMGSGDLRDFINRAEVQMIAVCDVDQSHRDKAKDTVDKKYGDAGCAGHNDFREVIGRKDIDAVMIATPDHWHAIPVIEAARAGKDMHCQKPLALTIHQGRMMSDTCRRYGVVFQTGSQQRSDRRFRFACELVRNGRIGKLLTIEVGLPTGSQAAPEPAPVPEGFDYDRWLGPAPWAPYCNNRCHWNFRWILDYSGGQVTDWGAHHCDIAQWGAGTSYTGPVEIEGQGDFPRDGLWDAAMHYRFEAAYAQGFKMIVADGATYPNGVKFIGTDGWVFVSRQKIEARPPSLLTTVFGPNEIHLYESSDHKGNFLACVKTRGETIATIENAHRSVSIAHLGNIAMRLGRKVRWNPDAERFVNDPEADGMLNRAMRAPWHL